jgi:tetratricopeptide (TPR) repeat protein
VLDIQAEQHEHGQAFGELYEAVAGLKRRHDLHPCAVRPRDGLALRRDSERELVQELVRRFRDLPAEQRRRLPALWNSLAQLEVVVGDWEAGQQDFQEVASLVTDPLARAEAFHNVYRTALERRDHGEALAALRAAAGLGPDAFEPFPLAQYEPLAILGADGFAVRFLCAEKASGARVLVKALRPDSLDRDLEALARDVAALRELDHPALARVRAFGRVGADPARPYLVVEHFDAPPLAEHVAAYGPLAPEQWLEVAWPIARALQAAHARGVLHRSLRPSCVLLRKVNDSRGERWRVKVLDTGLSLKRAVIHASASHPEARALTALGRGVARLVPFAASEVVGRPKGQVWVGPHSDVYSFGRLCAFALTGKPDPGRADLAPLPEGWKALLGECTAWTIAGRPAHFGIVLERLAQLAGPGEILARIDHDLYEDVIAEHSATLASDPTCLAAYLGRANAYARQGEHAKAVADYTEAIKLSPEDASLYRRRGLSHARNQDLDSAIADHTEALRREPRDVEARANRGLAFAQKGEYDKAVADYTEALLLSPRDESLHYNRGNAYYAQRDFDRAVADYTEAIRVNPKNAWALGNRGKAHALRGDHARAVADFSRVLQLDPANRRALADRAASYSELGRHDRAVADYTAALALGPSSALYHDRGMAHAATGDADKAIADFTEALALDPNNVGALLLRGRAYAERDEPEKALADFDEAIRLAPDSAAAYYRRGNVHAQRGDHDRAAADFTDCIRLLPDYAPAYFNRGNAHAGRGDHDRAVADYTEAIRLAPEDAAPYTNRGNSYCSLSDLGRAVADYTRALELEPGDALTLCNRANAHARLGNLEKALADYSEAIRVDPDNARAYNGRGAIHAERGELEEAIADFSAAIERDARLARAYHNRGNARLDSGDPSGAVADFGEAVRIDPAYVPAWYNRGIAHAELGEVHKALADFDEAIRLNPGHAGAYNNRGNARRRLGDDAGALADFTSAIGLAPGFSMPYFNRANVHADRGEYEQALADFTEALRLNPDDLAGYLNRGRVYTLRGEYERAIADNEEALRRAPDDVRILNNLAWLWATCPVAELRNGPRAVEYSRRACEATGWEDAGHLDTLAAAYAACGEFEEAARWERLALEKAPEAERADFRAAGAVRVGAGVRDLAAGLARRETNAPGKPGGSIGSRRVLRVEPHVLVRQVAGPEGAAAGAEGEAQAQVDVPLAPQVRRGGGAVERLRHPAVVQQQVAQPQRQLLLLELHAGVTRRRDDPPPVGVRPEDRRLDQRALGHRLRHAQRLAVVAQPLDLDGHQVAGPLRVGDDRPRQFGADPRDRPGEARQPLPLQAGHSTPGERLAVGEQQQRVVGAGVPLDADAVEAPRRGAARHGGQVVRRHGGVAEDEGEQGRHVRPDHGGPLGHAGQPDVPAVDRNLPGDDLGARVGGEDGVGEVVERLRGVGQRAGRGPDARLDLGHGQVSADDPRRADEELLGPAADGLGGDRGHAAGVFEPARAGAGVGVARAEDDPAGVGGGDALLADADGGGADAVLGEHPRGGGGGRADGQGEVEAGRVGADAAADSGVAEAAGQVPVRHRGALGRFGPGYDIAGLSPCPSCRGSASGRAAGAVRPRWRSGPRWRRAGRRAARVRGRGRSPPSTPPAGPGCR